MVLASSVHGLGDLGGMSSRQESICLYLKLMYSVAHGERLVMGRVSNAEGMIMSGRSLSVPKSG